MDNGIGLVPDLRLCPEIADDLIVPGQEHDDKDYRDDHKGEQPEVMVDVVTGGRIDPFENPEHERNDEDAANSLDDRGRQVHREWECPEDVSDKDDDADEDQQPEIQVQEIDARVVQGI